MRKLGNLDVIVKENKLMYTQLGYYKWLENEFMSCKSGISGPLVNNKAQINVQFDPT